jgi:dTDP-4-amino-4,6-dideoxygalactose transaminase
MSMMVREPKEFLIKGEGPWHQEVHEFGLNYRLPDVLCALGISQVSRLLGIKRDRDLVFANILKSSKKL